MEAERHALRQVHGGDGFAAEILGIEDHDVGGVGVGVVDVRHDPPVVLVGCVVDRGVGIAGDEHHLLGRPARAEVVDLDRAGLEVVLVARALGAGEPDRVSVAGLAPEASFIVAGELVGAVASST